MKSDDLLDSLRPSGMSDADVKSLVKRFYALQNERVEAYRLFDEKKVSLPEEKLPGSDEDEDDEAGDDAQQQNQNPVQHLAGQTICDDLIFNRFTRGYEAYLRTGPHYDFVQYRQLVNEITLGFSGISKEIIQIKDRFREVHSRSDLAGDIERVQETEKEKLELTAKLQIAKQNVLDHPETETYKEEVQEIKRKIIKTIAAISEALQDFKYDSEELE